MIPKIQKHSIIEKEVEKSHTIPKMHDWHVSAWKKPQADLSVHCWPFLVEKSWHNSSARSKQLIKGSFRLMCNRQSLIALELSWSWLIKDIKIKNILYTVQKRHLKIMNAVWRRIFLIQLNDPVTHTQLYVFFLYQKSEQHRLIHIKLGSHNLDAHCMADFFSSILK
jgi:hypothetical protein